MWFWTADPHLGHSNIIKYCKRPFLSREEEGLLALVDRGTIPARELHISPESTQLMNDTIIDSINNVVGYDDTLVIVGDFCWTPRDNAFNVAKKYRDRINCKNLFLIWGNHDDRRILTPLFKACYDQYIFNVDGQKIFASHYPCRSWEGAHHGSWSVFGHVHNLFGPEDSGNLMPYEEKIFKEGFNSVLNRYFGNDANQDKIVQELLAVCASLKGIDLTLDVGVDNRIRGESIPFGTPWSMDELRVYMDKKKSRWLARSEGYRNLRPPSTSKGGNPDADPKF